MATLIVTPAQLELINSLSEEEIPIKLRCAICSRLAVNAFRLPCCDQAICETCQSTLPTTCPVCEHSPVSAEDCKPHKALRTTIKVFLRTEEKKREALRLKEIKEATPIPVEAPAPVEVPVPESSEIAEVTINQSPSAEQPASEVVQDAEQNSEAEKDVPHQSIEEISAAQEPVETNGEDANITEGNENGVEQLEPTDETAKEGSKGPVGLDGTATGGFPAMGMGGDFNQMQMLMAMQNGMGAGGFGNFPMMGMSGMNMDPMMMQNMFMNGGFGAGSMGMNGMNMGMGMGGFDGGVGGAGYNGWNGQQSWNVGPDNFNHPNAAGMMGHGDYRANNSGYAPNASGFNPQGNYGRSQYNEFQNNGYGNNQGFQARGRGRGRGFGGRGGYGHAAQDFSHQVPPKFGQQPNGPSSETGSIPKGPKSEAGTATNVDEYGRELRPKSESRVPETEQPERESTVAIPEEAKEDAAKNVTDAPQAEIQEENAPMPIRSLEDEENAAAYTNAGYNAYGQGAYSNPHYGGRNGYMQPPVKVVDVPINAPTGPKAMREGLPNVGFRGRPAYPVPVARTNGSVSGSVAPESERGGEREREPEAERERDRKRSRSRDRTHRSRRHRSDEELSEDEKETERRRERRRERRKLREEEDEARGKEERERGDEEEVKKDEIEEGRSRSASPKRSSHRSSRREKDKYRDSEKDSKYRERDRDEHKSSRHRSHRSRHEERSRSRDRDRDRERRRHSRRGSAEPEAAVDEVKNKERRQSVVSISASALEIKGASSRRKPLSSSTGGEIPSGPRSERTDKERSSHHSSSRRRDEESRPSKDNRESNSHSHSRKESKSSTAAGTGGVGALDPHTQERLRRDNERIQKEMRKLAALNGGSGGGIRKRSRDEGDAGKSGRKKGRRGGVVVDGEHDEERVKRLEAEREGSRWA